MILTYISSCDKDGGIYRYELSDSGLLREIDFTKAVTPSYMAIDGNTLHTTLRAPYEENDYSAYTTFDITSDGTLTNMGKIIPSDGISACHLSVVGGVAYATNYSTGSLKRFPDKLLVREGGSVHPKRQISPHPHCIIPTPDGKYLVATDLGRDTLTVFDKELGEVSEAKAYPGSGPRHVTFSPDGKLAYVINELRPVATVYRYSDGQLERLADYPALPYEFCGKFNGEGAGSAIRCVGDYLFVALREENKITCFKRVGEELEYVFSSSCGGDHPRDFNVYGDTLISANMLEGEVSVFKIDFAKGLTKIQSIKMATPTCILFRECN